jgi:hypothetical protein
MMKRIYRFPIILLMAMSLTLPGQSLKAQEILWTSPYSGIDVATDDAENVLITEGHRTIKLTPGGDTLWTRTLDKITAIAVATDPWENVIVAGYTYKEKDSLRDYITVKYTPDGDTVWTRIFDSGARDECQSVTADPLGNVIVTGYSFGFGPLGDYCTIKYDPDGNVIWKRTYNWGWYDLAEDVVVDGDGNVIVSGWSDNNMNWDWCTVKYSPYGDTLWIRRLDIGIDDLVTSLTTDSDDNIIVTGEVGSGHDSRAFAIKYDSTGDTLWVKDFYDIWIFWDVARDISGNIALVSVFSYGPTDHTTITVKCDANGDTLWTTRYSDAYCDAIATDNSGNIIITGDMTIKYGDCTEAVEQDNNPLPQKYSLAQNYPNPFNSKTQIQYTLPEDSHVKLEIFNILGQLSAVLVDGLQSQGHTTVYWDASSFPSGIYIYRLQAEYYVLAKKMVLLK